MAGFGVSCDSCSSDGAQYCIDLAIDQLDAYGTNSRLDERSVDDVLDDPSCEGEVAGCATVATSLGRGAGLATLGLSLLGLAIRRRRDSPIG